MINVLVTGVGAIIGYGIINSLKMQNEYPIRIVGMDIYDDAYGQFLCDIDHSIIFVLVCHPHDGG